MGKGTQEQKKAKILKVLELQQKGITYKSMTKDQCTELLGYSKKTTLYNLMTREGYIYDKEQGIFTKPEPDQEIEQRQEQIDGQMTIEETMSDNVTDTEITLSDKHQTNVIQVEKNKETSISNMSDKHQINITLEKMQRIDRMLEWFESIQSIEPINNELVFNVKAPNKAEDRKTIYIDKGLWDRLDRFYQSHRQYKKNDLINQAIYEYLEKIENIIR